MFRCFQNKYCNVTNTIVVLKDEGFGHCNFTHEKETTVNTTFIDFLCIICISSCIKIPNLSYLHYTHDNRWTIYE